jgi:mannonate dehydratase
MKLGLSHQRPESLTPEYLRYLRQVGVEALEVRLPRAEASRDRLAEIKGVVEAAGLELHEVMLEDSYNCARIATGRPGADEDVESFCAFLRDLGDLGITATTYAWHTGGAYQTGRTTTRGCETRLFRLSDARSLPKTYEREYGEAELWENYERFAERVLPVATKSGVRLQLHPNDPPVDHAGVARLFKSTEAFRRAMAIGGHSPSWGILFCVGTWAEMAGSEGHGEDIHAAIGEFAPAGLIHQVHLRNIDRPLPDFAETLPDDGYLDLAAIVRSLARAGFDGMIVPDHVPVPLDSVADHRTMEAYSLGFIRGIIRAAESATT